MALKKGRGANSYLTERTIDDIAVIRQMPVDAAGVPLPLQFDGNGFLKVTGVPFTGDVNFDGNITQVGSQDVAVFGLALDGITYTGKKALTLNTVMYGLYNDTQEILPVGVDVLGSFDTDFAAFYTNASVSGIAGAAIANQSNAPGSMPSATLSGFGQPIDYENVGDGFGGDAGLVVNAAIGDGFGAPIGSNVPGQPMDNVASLNVLAATYSGYGAPIDSETVGDGIGPDTGLVVNAATYDGYGNPIDSDAGFLYTYLGDGNGQLMGSFEIGGFDNPYGRKALVTAATLFDSYGNEIISDSGSDAYQGLERELLVRNNSVAVGGVAVSPAIDPRVDGFDQYIGSKVQPVASLNLTYSSVDQISELTTGTYDGDGGSYADAFALDTAMTFWGRQGVSDAVDTATMWDDGTIIGTGPIVNSANLAALLDAGTGEVTANYPVTGFFMNEAADPMANSGFGAASVTNLIRYAGDPVGPDNPIDVKGPQAFNSSGVVDAPAIVTIASGKVLQNFTIGAIWDGSPTADTFTATLEGSFLGTYTGADLVVLKTLNAGNLNDSISGVPYPYSRLNLSAVSLVTSTGINVVATGAF